MRSSHRLDSIAGVARALMATVGVEQAVHILVCQYGWDLAFAALARCEGPQGGAALWQALTHLSADGSPGWEKA